MIRSVNIRYRVVYKLCFQLLLQSAVLYKTEFYHIKEATGQRIHLFLQIILLKNFSYFKKFSAPKVLSGPQNFFAALSSDPLPKRQRPQPLTFGWPCNFQPRASAIISIWSKASAAVPFACAVTGRITSSLTRVISLPLALISNHFASAASSPALAFT